MKRKKLTSKQVASKYGFKSGLEETISKQLESLDIPVLYETKSISYTKPETKHTYRPDFILPNGIIIETKGRFVLADRKKHILIKEQHPELDIRLVFQNPNVKISKNSKTTYADWADKNNIKWAAKSIPEEWIKE